MSQGFAKGVLVDIFFSEHSSKGIALAVSLGVMIGILPKANLIVLILASMMFLFRTNLVAGIAAALATTLCAPNFDSMLHVIGKFFLSISWLQGTYRFAFSLPLVPWTGLDNTVVVGGLLIGIVQFLPTYTVVRKLRENQLVTWQMTQEEPVPE